MFTMGTGTVPVAWGWRNLSLSLWYTVPVLLIIAAHEGGHWWAARRVRVSTTGPYVIPWPLALSVYVPWLPAMGTFGAFLTFKDPLPSKLAEWDIAFAGLWAGFLVTLICTVVGAWLSQPATGFPRSGRFWVPGVVTLLLPSGLSWHPLLMAARFGWCLTVFSLIPLRPFDGGRLLNTASAAWATRRWQVVAVGLICGLCWVS